MDVGEEGVIRSSSTAAAAAAAAAAITASRWTTASRGHPLVAECPVSPLRLFILIFNDPKVVGMPQRGTKYTNIQHVQYGTNKRTVKKSSSKSVITSKD